MSSSGSGDARAVQLRRVFVKALDVSIEAVHPNDIKESFGPVLQDRLGNALDGNIVKQLGKLKSNIEACFESQCRKHNVDAALSTKAGSDQNMGSAAIAGVGAAAADIEIQQLREAILKLKMANATLQEESVQLTNSIRDQIAALQCESQKIQDAAEQCAHS